GRVVDIDYQNERWQLGGVEQQIGQQTTQQAGQYTPSEIIMFTQNFDWFLTLTPEVVIDKPLVLEYRFRQQNENTYFALVIDTTRFDEKKMRIIRQIDGERIVLQEQQIQLETATPVDIHIYAQDNTIETSLQQGVNQYTLAHTLSSSDTSSQQ